METWTINRLSAELGIDRRTLVARLRDVQPASETTRSNGAVIKRYALRDVFAKFAKAADDINPSTAKARLDTLRGDILETDLAAKRGELIPAIEFERALAAAFKTVATGLETLPELLERHAGLDGAAIERVIGVVDALRNTLYEKLGNSGD